MTSNRRCRLFAFLSVPAVTSCLQAEHGEPPRVLFAASKEAVRKEFPKAKIVIFSNYACCEDAQHS